MFALLLALVMPAVVSAQSYIPNATTGANAQALANLVVCPYTGISNIICNVHRIINSLIPLLIALGVVYFVWGVVQYIIGGSEESRKDGRQRIIYGIIGFAVIIGLWGIVNIIVNTFHLGGQTIALPTVQSTTTAAASGAACDLPPNPKLQNFLGYVTCILNNSVIPLIFAIAFVAFIWGAVQFLVIGAGDETKRTKGKQLMIWGIIGLVVMLGVWGIVKIVGGTFGVNTSVLPQVKP